MPGLFFNSGIDKGFEKDLLKMDRQLNTFGRTVETQGANINKTFTGIGRNIAAFVSVAAIGAAGKELITFSKDLETSLIEVATISKVVTEDFDGYREQLLALSTDQERGAQGAIKLTEAFYDLVSAGFDGAEGLELLSTAGLAATAGFVEASTAADGITTVLNAWGKSVSEAAEVSDIFFKTVEKGKTTFPELGKNISDVAPLAASMGISFEEMSGAIATMTKQGTPTTKAFTQIQAVLNSVNKVLGDGFGEVMTYQEALIEVQKQAGGSQNKLREMLGSVEAVNGVLALTGKNAATAAEDLAAMNNSLGATEAAAAKVTQTTAHQILILKNNILAALEPLGTEAAGVIGDLARSVNEAFESGNAQKFLKLLALLTTAFITYKVSVIALSQIQKLRRAIILSNVEAMQIQVVTGKKVTAGNLVMAKSFQKMKAAFLANPIGILVTGLTLAIPLISEFVEAQKDTVKVLSETDKLIKKNTESQAQEIAQAGAFIRTLKETNAGSAERNKLIKEINSKYGTTLKNLKDEEAFLAQIDTAYTSIITGIKKKIALQTQDEILTRLIIEQNKANAELVKTREKLIKLEESKGIKTTYAYIKSVQDVVKEINAYEKQIESLTQFQKDLIDTTAESISLLDKIPPSPPPPLPPSSDDLEESALAELELQNQLRINEITKQFGQEEALQDEFNRKRLENELLFLKEKQKLVTDELEKARIQEQILTVETGLSFDAEKEDLDKLLKQYATFLDKREKIQKSHQKDIAKLLKNGYVDQANEAKKAQTAELAELDSNFAQNNEKFTTWLQEDLPGIVKDGVTALDEEIKKLKINIEITDDSNTEEAIQKIALLVEKIKVLNEKLKKLQSAEDSDTKAQVSSINEIVDITSQSIGQLQEGLAQELSELASSFAGVFNTLSSESSSSSEKISGLISVIVELGNIIKENIVDTFDEEAKALDQVNIGIADRIQSEIVLNQILVDRDKIIRESSAFLESDYKANFVAAGQALTQSTQVMQSTLEALRSGLVLTTTGVGKGLLGISKTTEQFSFTMDQIVNGWSDLSKTEALGTLANIFDPLDLFGGDASADAAVDAYNKIRDGFNAALTSMGKTAADMAIFSSEEWSNFYTILDEGGFIVEGGTKRLVESMREAQEQYTSALEEMKTIISSVAGDLGNSLADAMVNSLREGTDALETFGNSLNDVLLQMATAEMNELFFRGLFNQLQQEMEESMTVGDQSWEDDILRFYDSLPGAIQGAQSFLEQFDEQMKDLGFVGIIPVPDDPEVVEDPEIIVEDPIIEDPTVSRAGQIAQAITEETGSLLVGRLGAIMLSNERIALFSADALDYAVQNLIYMKQITENTNYLPEIASNTKKTYEKLESI